MSRMLSARNSVLIYLILIWLASPAFSLAEDKEIVGANELNVVATTGMIADVVRGVGGELTQVMQLMNSGVDPHLYKPTRQDMLYLSRADIVFYNGLMLEGKMVDGLIRIATSGKPVVAITEQIEKSYLYEPEDGGGHYDPHVWMDPVAWRSAVTVVKEKLCELKPENCEKFEERASAYKAELDKLHQYSLKSLESIPKGKRVLVTAHDAFHYFGERYDIEVVAIQGISTESEAGVNDIEKLVSLLVDRKIQAVFVESTVSKRNINALVAGAAANGHTVKIGGELFSDAMGNPGTYEGTYIGMVDHNVTAITHALGGQAPERGMRGELTEKSSEQFSEQVPE